MEAKYTQITKLPRLNLAHFDQPLSIFLLSRSNLAYRYYISDDRGEHLRVECKREKSVSFWDLSCVEVETGPKSRERYVK